MLMPKEFKDISWAVTEEELYDRLLKIKGLQVNTAAKFEKVCAILFFQRMDKRRRIREDELIGRHRRGAKAVCVSADSKSDAVPRSILRPNYFTPAEATQS